MVKMHAVVVSKTGGPESLEYVEVDRPQPKEGEVLVRLEAIGVNFIDVYHRTGLYPMSLLSRFWTSVSRASCTFAGSISGSALAGSSLMSLQRSGLLLGS